MSEDWEKVSTAIVDVNIKSFGQSAILKDIDCKIFGIFSNLQLNSEIGTITAEMSDPILELKTSDLKNLFFAEGTKIKINNQIFSIIRIEFDGKTSGSTILFLRLENGEENERNQI